MPSAICFTSAATPLKVLGFSSDELLEQGRQLWLERIHPEDAARVGQAYRNLFASGEQV